MLEDELTTHLHEIYTDAGIRVGSLDIDERGVIARDIDGQEIGVFQTAAEAASRVLAHWRDTVKIEV